MHFLSCDGGTLSVHGVGEIKSFQRAREGLLAQIGAHIARSRMGMRLGADEYGPEQTRVVAAPVRIAVVVSDWKLPRTFRIEAADGRILVRTDPPAAPTGQNSRVQDEGGCWWITLRWSREALEAAAHGLTFWYVGKLGEAIFREGVPPEWSEMSPAEAGQNAVRMMLYAAILRARSEREEQRAIAMYNSHGFGYALGMNFRNDSGRREMLWFDDLEQIASHGHTSSGCRITDI